MDGFARRCGPLGRLAFALAAMACAPQAARAGAWTQNAGEGLIITSLWGWVGHGAPWGGFYPTVQQSQAELQTYGEYGLSDVWTIYGQMAIECERLSPPAQSLYVGPDYSSLGLRAKLWATGGWVVSGEATMFFPGATYPRSPAQAGDNGGAAEGRGLAGYSFSLGSMPGFLDLELAWRFRTAGPPDEIHADATIGLKPRPGVIVMLQNFAVVSAPSINRSFPAWRQDMIEASMVVPLSDRWSLQLGWFTTLLAVKTNTERGLAVALWRKF